MKFWCFHFEGWFAPDSTEYPNQGVFSECLVQSDEFIDAEFLFLAALAERKINLIEVSEQFSMDTDPNEMDPGNPDNVYWFEWCDETEAAGQPTFETFHLYPAEDVNNTVSGKGN